VRGRRALLAAPTEIETRLAERICRLVPSSTGAHGGSAPSHHERHPPARGHTGRDLIVSSEGCYHGHSDSLLVKAGSARSL